MVKMLLLWAATIMQMRANFIFDQHYITLRVLVKTIFSLEVPVD
jgi:hypothetical protein